MDFNVIYDLTARIGTNGAVIFYVIVGCLLALCLFLQYRDRKKQRILKQIKKKKNTINYLYPFFFIFVKTPFFRNSFEKVKKRIILSNPGEVIEINYLVTKQMLKGLVIAIVAMIAFIASSNKDIFYICFGVAISYITYSYFINRFYESAEEKIMQQMKEFITAVRHNFYIYNHRVDDAVYSAINECPYEISLHASKIYEVLKSPSYTIMHKNVDKYVDTAPNRFILSFVAIATSLMEYGDKTLENGKSMFLSSLMFLKDEVHVSCEKVKMAKKLFQSRPLICIIPVFMIKPIQWWVNENWPEIVNYYTGVYGITCEVIIFLLVISCYVMVMNLKDLSQKEIKEHDFLRWMSNLPFISPLLTKLTNKNFSKSQRVNDKLKLTGEHMGYKQFLLKRFLFAVSFFVGFQLVIIVAQQQEKDNILSNYADAFSTSFVSNEETKQEMVYAAEMYLRNRAIIGNNFDIEVVTEDIQVHTSIKKPLLAEIVAQVVVEKVNQYNDVYYRWYFILIGLGLAVIGYEIPYLLLLYKIKTVQMSMEDEVSQFQTIVIMLMHVEGMSIKTMLEWMERFSYCFKESIINCINELPINQEAALKKLRDSETFYPFKRFINNFLCVNDQGIINAFDEIVSDRENEMDERKSNNEAIFSQKSTYATIICLIPFGFTLIFYIVYPFMAYMNDVMNYIG